MTSREPALNIPPVVIWIAAALIGVHVLRWALSDGSDLWLLLILSFIPARYGEAAAVLPGGEAAWFWTPLTYAFLHADPVHLTINLVWMASFGSAVARRFGPGRFLAIWAITAVAGSAAHFLTHIGDEAIVIGASGAVSGITAAAARFAFTDRGPLGNFGPSRGSYLVPALSLADTFRNGRAVSFILIWLAMNILFGISGSMVTGMEGEIAWQAHLGGFIAGLVAFSMLDPVTGNEAPPR